MHIHMNHKKEEVDKIETYCYQLLILKPNVEDMLRKEVHACVETQ